MIRFLKTAGLTVFAVLFFSLSPALSAQSNLDSNECLVIFKKAQNAYSTSNLVGTAVSGDSLGMFPYTLEHRYKNGRDYSLWQSLSGEISGFALRLGQGFDFNQNRSFIGHLSWHPALIWERFFADKTKLSGYNCTLSGRTRVAGRKSLLLRLSASDDLRYSFVTAVDENSYLPVELNVLGPSGYLALKITVTAMQSAAGRFPFSDESFDKMATPKRQLPEGSAPWSELRVPKDFKLVGVGAMPDIDGGMIDYQLFSDGVVDFRVYRNPRRQNLLVPTLTNGTLTVTRRNTQNFEYAVVGEIPLNLGEYLLSGLIR